MVLDHIAEFVADVPLWFHWVGRISAPIFLFCCVWSFDYTRNRKKYLMRLYLAGLGMSFIQYYLYLSNNIFRTLFSVCFLLYAWDLYKNKDNGKKYLFLCLFWQISTCVLSIYLLSICSNESSDFFTFIIPALFGNIFNLEGGFIFVVLGIIIYIFKDNNYKLAISFILFDVFYFWFSTTSIIIRVLQKLIHIFGSTTISDIMETISIIVTGAPSFAFGGSPIFENYQWMMIFSLIFILFYNGKEGKKQKWFFYVFYPTHLVILCLIFGVN